MEVDIYKAKKSPDPAERRYIFVPKGKKIDELPPDLKNRIGDLNYEKTIDIKPGEKRIALDSDEAIRNIESSGYHEQGTRIEVSVTSRQN
jgi:hypothetical protein